MVFHGGEKEGNLGFFLRFIEANRSTGSADALTPF